MQFASFYHPLFQHTLDLSKDIASGYRKTWLGGHHSLMEVGDPEGLFLPHRLEQQPLKPY